MNENKNILHLLYRRPRIVNENGDVEECAVTNSHGEFSFDFHAMPLLTVLLLGGGDSEVQQRGVKL